MMNGKPENLNNKFNFWTQLPKEIKLQIFYHLLPEDLVSMSIVNKECYTLSCDATLWGNLYQNFRTNECLSLKAGIPPKHQFINDYKEADINLAVREKRFLNLIKQGDLSSVKSLVQKEPAYLQIKGNYHNPFYWAVSKGHLELVKWLIQQCKESLDQKDGNKHTLLYTAASRGHEDIVRFLVGQGANIDKRNNLKNTPLHAAARGNHTKVLTFLLDSGAYVDAKDEFGQTPLYIAVLVGNIESIQCLVKYHANINEKNDYKETPLHAAVSKIHVNVVNFLLGVGALVDEQDIYGYTPLHRAVSNNQIDLVKYLIQKGASLDKKCIGKQSLLHVAVSNNSFEVVQYLLQKGASPNEEDYYGHTPLDIAKEKGYAVICKAIIKCLNPDDQHLQEEFILSPLKKARSF
jgi:ankyrin repeat protein